MEKSKGVTYRFMFVFVVVLLVAFIFFWNFQVRESVRGVENRIDKFTVDPSLIKLLVHPNQLIEKSVRIKNTWGNELEFSAYVSGSIEGVASIKGGDESFSLGSGRSKKIILSVFPDLRKRPGIYVGKIIIESEETAEIPVIIEVESDYVLFDSNLNAKLLRNPMPGDKIDFTVKIFDMQMGAEPINVRMEYALSDMSGNEIMTETESVVVMGQSEFNKAIALPSTLKPGLYVFSVRSVYGTSVGTSTYLLQVSRLQVAKDEFSAFSSCIENNFCLFGMFSIFLIIMVTVVLLYAISLLGPQPEKRIFKEKVIRERAKTREERSSIISPMVSRPYTKVPKIRLPKIKLPKIPRVKIPKIRIPRVKVPRVKVPRVKIPKLRMPRLPRKKILHMKLPKLPKIPKSVSKAAEVSKIPEEEIFKPPKFEKKRIQKFKPPKIFIPTLKLSKVKLPRIKPPKLKKVKEEGIEEKVQETKKISFEAPRIPKIKLPKIPRTPRIPRFKMLRVKVPKIKIPRVKVPRVKVPRVKVPRVKVPRVKVPTVKVPTVKVPRVKIPKLRMPRLPRKKVQSVSIIKKKEVERWKKKLKDLFKV